MRANARPMGWLAGAALGCVAVWAQSGEGTPGFGLADVHVRAPNAILAMRSGFAHGRFELLNATMVDLVGTAWSVDADKVVGGPDWLELDRFDVVALAPPNSTPDTLRSMLRGLLTERFHLAAHKDSRDLPAYALTASKKVQLEAGDANEEGGCKFQPGKNPPSPRGTPGEPVVFVCRNISMAAFVSALPTMRGASGYLFNYPVVDRTGLKGGWNFTLKWSTRIPGVPGTAAADAVPIFDALEKQLGLKLELTKAPTPVVVVDSVNQKPTDNLPEVSEKLPPPPMEFEVADIQPADPDDGIKGSNVSIQRGGRVRVNMPLKGLIQEAWNDWNPDRIVGGPKSMETARFNVEAKASSPDLTDGPAVWNGVDIDSMRMMLRAVLVERFHLQAHLEDRPVSGYALVAGRPKLRKGGPGGPSELQRGPGGRREGSEAGESRGFAAGDLPEHDAGAVCGRTD